MVIRSLKRLIKIIIYYYIDAVLSNSFSISDNSVEYYKNIDPRRHADIYLRTYSSPLIA